ncbi:hypothetical protein NGM10_12555 [Halorussus salilacus]|uniref:hypothetical protein n=1 Tax=Halorussus salilacus TaxID=2953750 RepID=UPI00209D3B21|nr:hypothetical protein [Halorussus salilacus]USZ67554.1 hypothetical protein NGM10_12555 [Halorussus salilacus]
MGTDGDARTLRVHPTTAAPPGTPVRHFDELPERAQQLLAERPDRGTVAVSPELAATFANEPVVVFSEYLRVERA